MRYCGLLFKKKSLLKVFFQVQKWSSFGLIFMKLALPEKLGTLNMVHITLPDGSQRSYDQPVTPAAIAADIGPGLSKAALLAVVDDAVI